MRFALRSVVVCLSVRSVPLSKTRFSVAVELKFFLKIIEYIQMKRPLPVARSGRLNKRELKVLVVVGWWCIIDDENKLEMLPFSLFADGRRSFRIRSCVGGEAVTQEVWVIERGCRK